MKLFRLDASIRIDGSVSRQVADTAERSWLAEHPGGTVIRRDVGREPLPADAWAAAVARDGTDERTRAGRDLAATLADELIESDAYLLAVPLYNFGAPQHVKTWVDLVIADPRLGPGGTRPLAGRPAVLVVARGGGYGPGTPREGWDHATPWLRRILSDVWGLDLRLSEAELTLAEVNPAMADLRPLAQRSLLDAHRAAEDHARELVRLATAA